MMTGRPKGCAKCGGLDIHVRWQPEVQRRGHEGVHVDEALPLVEKDWRRIFTGEESVSRITRVGPVATRSAALSLCTAGDVNRALGEIEAWLREQDERLQEIRPRCPKCQSGDVVTCRRTLCPGGPLPGFYFCRGCGVDSPMEQASESSLLPCPFCGGEARVQTIINETYRVVCSRCRLGTDWLQNPNGSGNDPARDAWNRRVG